MNNNKYSEYLFVDADKCPQNHACPVINLCPVKAISQKGFDAPIVDNSLCIRCAKCVRKCGMGALILKKND